MDANCNSNRVGANSSIPLDHNAQHGCFFKYGDEMSNLQNGNLFLARVSQMHLTLSMKIREALYYAQHIDLIEIGISTWNSILCQMFLPSLVNFW